MNEYNWPSAIVDIVCMLLFLGTICVLNKGWPTWPYVKGKQCDCGTKSDSDTGADSSKKKSPG